MPRRSILSTLEKKHLFALPEETDELIRLYTFTDRDLAIIKQHRGPANRLGFAIQLCYMRYPGVVFAIKDEPPKKMLHMVAKQLNVGVAVEFGKNRTLRVFRPSKWSYSTAQLPPSTINPR